MAVEIFVIDWTKLYPFKDALTEAVSQEGGVYMVYKKTDKGGYDLQYVGKTLGFYKRFGTHKNSASHFMSEDEKRRCFIQFGLISFFAKSRMSHDTSPEQLQDIENYLINILQPDGNDISTKKGYKGDTIIIVNQGLKSHRLDKVVSNSPALLKLLSDIFRK
jgi:hypothetical protein